MNLSTLLGNQPLPLKSSTKATSNGLGYTEEEVRVAKLFCKLALASVGQLTLDPTEFEKDQGVVEVFQTIAQQNTGSNLGLLIRNAYRQYEVYMLLDSETLKHYPYVDANGEREKRNQSSITVLLRKAIADLVTKEVRDQMFNMYQAPKVSNG